MEVAKPVDARVRRVPDADVDAFHEQGRIFEPATPSTGRARATDDLGLEPGMDSPAE